MNMFYCAKADAVYLHLATNSNDVNLSYGFAGVQTNCGIEVQYAQAISSGANMFQNVTSELINLGYIPGSG
jgi:hypothetical protein